MTQEAHRSRPVAMAWLGAALTLAAAGCGKPKGAGGPGGMAVHVVGFRAVTQPVEERVAVIGTLAANESVDIKSELDGMVEEIGFEEGARVEAGAVLFRIDRSKQEASLAEAEANLKLAEATRGRYAALTESRAVSRQEADQAIASFESRQASVALMHAQLQDATMTAPFAGVMGVRLVSIGQYVAKGQLLTSVVETDPMKVECYVPERLIGRVAQGQAIEVRVAAYPDEGFRGMVYFVDPTIHAETRTVLVKARLPNPEGRLHAGMFANLDLILQVRERAVVIPESALLLEGERASVFIVDGGTAQPRPVTPGLRLAGALEIQSGLSPGETVVIEGTQKLAPGVPVQVRYDERPLDEIARNLAVAPASATVR